MPFIADISTCVPEYRVRDDEFINFYLDFVPAEQQKMVRQKLLFLSGRSGIQARYSCIPDFSGKERELFTGRFPDLDDRMRIYRDKAGELAVAALASLFRKVSVAPHEITHLITVSCTGQTAPGLEFTLAERFGWVRQEKQSINFQGCYAGIKALKQADTIARAYPKAKIAIVAVELCSLHFSGGWSDEELTTNLLFADGAAAVLVCGDQVNRSPRSFTIQDTGSAIVENSAHLMTWDITASGFRMYLDRSVPAVLRQHFRKLTGEAAENAGAYQHWAIHPGGARIVEGIREELQLKPLQVASSFAVLKEFGNMSSVTVLFVLARILADPAISNSQRIFSCAFGPGLCIEMITMSFCYTGVVSVPTELIQEDVA